MKLFPIISLLLFLTAGVIFFCIYNQWILITFTFPGSTKQNTKNILSTPIKKEVALYYWRNNKLLSEKKSVLWKENIAIDSVYLIESWLSIIEEEGVVTKKISLQSTCITNNNDELLVSFDCMPFEQEASTYTKLMILESLLTTLREALPPTITCVRFLVHHQPAHDMHLDFSYAWPTTGFYRSTNQAPQKKIPAPTKPPFTLMIDPSGDALYTGRVIGDNFERTITLQIAEHLKAYLESKLPEVRVILTRSPGESVDVLQNVTFANRLSVNMYLHLQIYHVMEPDKSIHCYYMFNSHQDCFATPSHQLSWVMPERAHVPILPYSAWAATAMVENLKHTQHRIGYKIFAPRGIPCRPLVGIYAPSFSLEIGLAEKEPLRELASAIGHALYRILYDVYDGDQGGAGNSPDNP